MVDHEQDILIQKLQFLPITFYIRKYESNYNLYLSYHILLTLFISLIQIIQHSYLAYTLHSSMNHSRHTHHLTNNFIYRYKPMIFLLLFCMGLNPHFHHLLANVNHDYTMCLHIHVTTILTPVSFNVCMITTGQQHIVRHSLHATNNSLAT